MTLTELSWILRKAPPPLQRSNIRAPYYVLRHSHVIKWGAVIGHNDETGHPILLY